MVGATPVVAMQAGSGDTLKQMIKAHLGVAVTYRVCIEWEYAASQVHVVEITDLGTGRDLYQYSVADGAPSPENWPRSTSRTPRPLRGLPLSRLIPRLAAAVCHRDEADWKSPWDLAAKRNKKLSVTASRGRPSESVPRRTRRRY